MFPVVRITIKMGLPLGRNSVCVGLPLFLDHSGSGIVVGVGDCCWVALPKMLDYNGSRIKLGDVRVFRWAK